MHKADNLPPSCAVVMKSGNLNFLEPSGPLRACNGTALPLLSSITNVTCVLQFSTVSLICLKRNDDRQLTVMLGYVKGKVKLPLCLP